MLLLALVPLAWWGLDHLGVFGKLNNQAEDWMFQFRGEIPAVDRTKPGNPPLKVMYVNVDARTVGHLGERPWPREYYALIIDALFKHGGVKALGLDFVLSPAGMKSELVDPQKAHDNDELLGEAMEQWPNAIMATIYSQIEEQANAVSVPPAAASTAASGSASNAPSPATAPAASSSAVRLAEFPYIYKNKTDPSKNAYPESPTFPLLNLDRIRTGMIDVATEYNAGGLADAVPRWIPLFAETIGPDHTNNIVDGFISFNHLDPGLRMDQEDKVMVLNPDGGKPLLLPKVQHITFYNMALKLALAYLNLDESNVRRTVDNLQVIDKGGKVVLDMPLREQQLLEINWFTRWDNPDLNPQVSMWDVLVNAGKFGTGTPAEQAEYEDFFKQFKDAIVLVGPVDPILQDVAPSPFDSAATAKVAVYGNLLKTFFSGAYIHRTPEWVKVLLQFALTLLIGGLAISSGHHTGFAKAAPALILFGYIAVVFEAFAHFNLVLPLVVPVGSAFTTAFIGAVVRLIDEEKQKKRIKGMFGTYLAPEVVNSMVESGEEPQLGGHNVVITCFFSDVQSFSTFSEVLTPGQLTDLMNEYFTAMVDILQAERGSLDKFIGDAIVAMFGAPVTVNDHALRAAVTTCRMLKRLGELRQKWVSEGDKWPDKVHRMRMRIGLNSGETIVGNMGSAARFNFTMMGDTVNLAARCESGAKQFGVYGMCTEDTVKAALAHGSDVVFRRLNKITVKGKTKPVEVYEIVCLRADATPDTLRCVELFERALELYFAQKWDDAKALFAEAQKLEPLQPGRDPGVAHNPSELMQEECDHMKAHPPGKNWNGVKEMTEK